MIKRTFVALILAIVMIIPQTTGLAYASSTPGVPSLESYNHSGSTLTVEWGKVSNATGYQVQYSRSRFFMKRHTFETAKQYRTSVTFKKVPNCKLFVRVRSVKKTDDGKEYSNWALSSNCKVNQTVSINRLKKGKKKFELRSISKERVGNYDTLQGGCTFKNTGWFILYNRNKSKCKIVKMNMKTKKIIKKSAELDISHGSSLTYNSDRKELCAAHGPYRYKTVSTIDPNTLRIKKTVTLTLTSSVPGSNSDRARSFCGITSIAYNNHHHVYVARLKEQGNIVCYDSNFNPVQYIKLSQKGGQLYQGVDSINDYILVLQSPANGGSNNIISIYDWTGKYLSTLYLGNKYEAETVFHRNGNLYVGFYRSFYRTYYVDKFQIKVYDGRKNKIKTRLKYTKLMRSNYLYKVTNL